MRTPLIALVGRPNVGKSTVFNRLVGQRMALVYDEPGVTRDRIFGEARIGHGVVRVVDTGGLDFNTDDVIFSGVRQQTQLAIEEADFVLFVVDAFAGVVPVEAEIAQMLRKSGKPIAVLANKIDGPSRAHHVADCYKLGLDPVLPVSAEHNLGFTAVEDMLAERLSLPASALPSGDADSKSQASDAPFVPAPAEAIADDTANDVDADSAPPVKTQVEWHGKPICVAVIGRPNAGKSSLINCLLGEERHLATAEAGTTRDAVDSQLTYDDQDYVLIDTAGVRRKRSIARRLEQFAVVAAFNSMDRADVTCLVLDGTTPPTDQDARIAAMAHDKGKGLILVINKWDLVENPEWREKYVEALRLQLPFAEYAPLVKLSAKTGQGIKGLFRQILAAQRERHRRVTTGELNRFFREVVNSHPPPIRGGFRPQLYYVSQPLVRPPTFVFASNRATDLHFSYVRYLSNALRKRYGFAGTPIWLKFRQRQQQPRA